jgi:F420-0:gamma-glutamyl ligase
MRNAASDAAKESAHRQSIRFPPSIAEAIRERALEADRTFSGEVVHRLRVSLNTAAGIDQDEIERLAALYHETIEGSS